ncbi:DUF3617 domain-containing protein [Massilia sp. PAMC28688]|uniref:DUF3617 domain-containing protein n=1 Tax=Massilia sp. PAMC28688 TaxID=2861283 RepID=UPI001C62F2CD|nr:DUF3617 domain-containing protein [Massilia sp. PAMC28688]QYF93837.1 DUF3617 domain-containing protein [Massilia sp. PAMC28688]
MKTTLIAATLFSAALCAAQASAQTLRPGLWEIRSSTPGGAGSGKAMAEHMARMKKEIAAMPAAQRQQMEAALAGQAASALQFTDDGMIMKHCITPDDVAAMDKLIIKEGGCTTQRSPMIGGVVKMNMSCTTPPSTGNGTIRFSGDTAYTMEMTMNTRFQGQNHTAKVSSSGKWLASSCGKVKPVPRAR